MATQLVLNDFNGNFTIGTGENYYLAEGVTHSQTSTQNMLVTTGTGGNNIYIAGTMVQLGNAEAINTPSTLGNGISITITSSGSILGSSDRRAIIMNGDNALVANNGTIVAGEPIRMDGDNAEVVNTGTIQSNFANSIFQTTGIDFGGDNASLTNSGLIETPRGILVANDIDLTNSGTISSIGDNINILSASTDTSHIINTGTITSAFGAAINGANSIQIVENSGTIHGGINLQGGNDLITNSGTITGDITFSTGFNSVYNAGLIMGEITFGSGNDLYRASGDGLATLGVIGGSGNDTLIGGSSGEILDGGADDDFVSGGFGEDVLRGDSGNDTLRGGADDDLLEGGTGDDNLRGDGGDDVIFGGDNDDKIFGGAGDDEIIGGEGKDVMRGNAGADTFVFLSEFDANTTDAIDRIRDFEQGIDKIDISAIAGFEFIGDGSFTGTGAEVRYQTTASGLRFEMDVDGDGTADMRINVNSISDLLESDFIL